MRVNGICSSWENTVAWRTQCRFEAGLPCSDLICLVTNSVAGMTPLFAPIHLTCTLQLSLPKQRSGSAALLHLLPTPPLPWGLGSPTFSWDASYELHYLGGARSSTNLYNCQYNLLYRIQALITSSLSSPHQIHPFSHFPLNIPVASAISN